MKLNKSEVSIYKNLIELQIKRIKAMRNTIFDSIGDNRFSFEMSIVSSLYDLILCLDFISLNAAKYDHYELKYYATDFPKRQIAALRVLCIKESNNKNYIDLNSILDSENMVISKQETGNFKINI